MRWIAGVILGLLVSGVDAGAMKIGVFLPANTPFWNKVELFASASGQSLGAEIHVFQANLNRWLMIQQVEAAAAGTREKFDALIFPNFLNSAGTMLQSCERHQVVCVLFNSDLDDQDHQRLGLPRENLRYWVGQMIPDDFKTSARLVQVLMESARTHRPGDAYSLVGVNGYQSDAPAIAREAGMREQLAGSPDVAIQQVIYTDWSGEDAHHRTNQLLQRYPDTDIIWSANYRTTTGILSALDESGLESGTDVFVNSFGISSDALDQLAQGKIEATAGGHFVEGAWAVILAYDAWHRFEEVEPGLVLHTPLLVVTPGNLADVRLALERLNSEPERIFGIDFTQFSRMQVTPGHPYRFSFDPILQALLAPSTESGE